MGFLDTATPFCLRATRWAEGGNFCQVTALLTPLFGAATAGGISSGLGLVGTVASAFGAISQGNSAAAQAKYQAQVAKNNQTQAYQNANYASAAGETQSYEQGLKERTITGAIDAGIAAGGIDVNSGSAKDVKVSQDILSQQDVQQVRQTAALQAYGYKTQATNFGAQAQLDTAQAGFDQEAGWLNGLGSLLTGAVKYGKGVESLFDSPTTDPFGTAIA